MIIAVASGKGGTGKTLVATNMALSLAASGIQVQLVDCDVEEPNDHIFLHPEMIKSEDAGLPVPHIDIDRCDYCRICSEACAFKAITVFLKTTLVFTEMCHGCGACTYLCPQRAIQEKFRKIGLVESGKAGMVELVQGKLNVGEPFVPPLIRKVKSKIASDRTVILDSPPGTSCPVIETVRGSDYCILVTEPTPFGLHDLDLAVEMAREVGVPCGVIINRAGANEGSVIDYCNLRGIPVLQTIPLDRDIAAAYSEGMALVQAKPEWNEVFLRLTQDIEHQLTAGRKHKGDQCDR